MNICNRLRRRSRPRLRNAPKNRERAGLKAASILVLAVALLIGAASTGRADFTVQAGAFVEGFQDFVTVASGVDPTDGTTYIVGRNSANQAVLRKYDSSGGRLS